MPISPIVGKVLQHELGLKKEASIASLNEHGVKMTALDGIAPILGEDGKVDRKKTAAHQAAIGLSYLEQAVSPDVAAIGVGMALASTESVAGRLIGGTVGLVLGGLVDVVEAVPTALLGAGYLVSAAVYKIRS